MDTKAQALMSETIEEENNDELKKLLLGGISPSPLNVKLAATRVASVGSEKRKETLGLLIKYGWDLNDPLDVNQPPVLR